MTVLGPWSSGGSGRRQCFVAVPMHRSLQPTAAIGRLRNCLPPSYSAPLESIALARVAPLAVDAINRVLVMGSVRREKEGFVERERELERERESLGDERERG